VTVSRFDVSPGSEAGVFRIEVGCSSGTYVRSLAADVGAALGGGAHLRRLRRTAVGRFTVDTATSLDDLGAGDVLAPAAAVAHLTPVTVDGEVVEAVGYGRPLDLDWPGAGPWAVLDAGGRLLAVYEPATDGRNRPAVVLAPA
jgi:tRNA pseudouridine55 synthase